MLNMVRIIVFPSPQDMSFKQIGDSPSQLDCQKSISSCSYLSMIVIFLCTGEGERAKEEEKTHA